MAGALGIVGDWWSLLIVRDALLGVRRFGEFQQSLGLAKNVLADRLRRLVGDGVLSRQGPERRPLYALTEKGRELAPVVVALMQWGDRWVSGGCAPVVVTDREDHEVDPIELRAGGHLLPSSELRFKAGNGAEPGTQAFLALMATRALQT